MKTFPMFLQMAGRLVVIAGGGEQAAQKARLKRLAGRRWTAEGAVLLRVEDTRSQARNREIARERLAELVRKALVRPKRRIPTKPTKGSVRRRLDAKKARGEVKSLRGKVGEE